MKRIVIEIHDICLGITAIILISLLVHVTGFISAIYAQPVDNSQEIITKMIKGMPYFVQIKQDYKILKKNHVFGMEYEDNKMSSVCLSKYKSAETNPHEKEQLEQLGLIKIRKDITLKIKDDGICLTPPSNPDQCIAKIVTPYYPGKLFEKILEKKRNPIDLTITTLSNAIKKYLGPSSSPEKEFKYFKNEIGQTNPQCNEQECHEQECHDYKYSYEKYRTLADFLYYGSQVLRFIPNKRKYESFDFQLQRVMHILTYQIGNPWKATTLPYCFNGAQDFHSVYYIVRALNEYLEATNYTYISSIGDKIINIYSQGKNLQWEQSVKWKTETTHTNYNNFLRDAMLTPNDPNKLHYNSNANGFGKWASYAVIHARLIPSDSGTQEIEPWFMKGLIRMITAGLPGPDGTTIWTGHGQYLSGDNFLSTNGSFVSGTYGGWPHAEKGPYAEKIGYHSLIVLGLLDVNDYIYDKQNACEESSYWEWACKNVKCNLLAALAWLYNLQNNTVEGNNYIATVTISIESEWLLEPGTIPSWGLTSQRGEDGKFIIPGKNTHLDGTAMGAFIYYKILGNKHLRTTEFCNTTDEDIKIGTYHGKEQYRSVAIKEAALETMIYLMSAGANQLFEPAGVFLEYQLSEQGIYYPFK